MGCSQGVAASEERESEAAPTQAAPTQDAPGDVSLVSTGERIIMGRYRVRTDLAGVIGEGGSGVCRKGTNLETGETVVVKKFKKDSSALGEAEDSMLLKLKRTIQVLQELQEPFEPVPDRTLWHAGLAAVAPRSLSMSLVDYSRGADGQPGPDPSDGGVYVVTELGEYSLKDYLTARRDEGRPLPKDSVKSIARDIVSIVAGLNAKGIVHTDLKPDNLMMFNGQLKLIDVDSCVKTGTPLSVDDSSISFSPCYCAPEWAQFILKGFESNFCLAAAPAMDVWSAGMTICELVTLNGVFKRVYDDIADDALCYAQALFRFMEWLSGISQVQLPEDIQNHDPNLVELLTDWLLVCDESKRKSCAQCLSHPYLAGLSEAVSCSGEPNGVLPMEVMGSCHDDSGNCNADYSDVAAAWTAESRRHVVAL